MSTVLQYLVAVVGGVVIGLSVGLPVGLVFDALDRWHK